jgi:hypothetical protein
MNLNHTSPRQVENLNGLQIYSIEDVSKGDKQVLMVISLVILFFVENSNYNLWKMHLIEGIIFLSWCLHSLITAIIGMERI